ncbi:MAG: type II/IV secretion system protein [Candidatus Magasanikbacteria bacterium]|nr:type II/IV secretion system protein [Candidatus Magasanikbacteria bacterium]
MLPQKLLNVLLKEHFKISGADMKSYSAKAPKVGKTLEQYLLDEGIVDETELYSEVAKGIGAPFIELGGKEIKKEVLNLVPPPFAQAHEIVAFDKSSTEIKLATVDPEDIQTIEFLHRKTGLNPRVYLTTPSSVKDALRRYHADLESDIAITQLAEGEQDTGDLKKAAQELPIINIVNSIFEHAVYEGASDIHIEPTEKEITVRYRVDGMLHPVMTLPKTVKNGIVARIKILANLKIDEHMKPQDGRIKLQIQDEKLALRVSIIPVYDGEKIVMRILHEGQKPLPLDALGFLPGPKKLVETAIKKPHGIILVTGPTGSGKTTTLYSLLGILNQPNVNISTIEDPIEYHVKGVNQSQINPQVGFTFATGLRAFLRQDPNIIMVGEIRDEETAEIAIHAAMTGHLVLSSLHTNDAPTTLPRLMDMGVPPFLIAFTANIIVAQRLVRKTCEFCKKEYKLEKAAISDLEKLFDVKQLTTLLTSQGVKLAAKEKNLESMTFYQGEGCRRCNNSGHKGRIGIYEVLEVDADLAQKINQRATADTIKDYARKKGMITMLEDGLVKAKQGITTIVEVLRVTKD